MHVYMYTCTWINIQAAHTYMYECFTQVHVHAVLWWKYILCIVHMYMYIHVQVVRVTYPKQFLACLWEEVRQDIPKGWVLYDVAVSKEC